MLRHMGVWKLTVTGPRALLDVYYGEVEVEGLGGDDKFDRNNLEYDACQEVAKGLGYKSYDDLPQQTAVNSYDEAEEVRQRLYDGEFPDTGKSSSVLGGDDFRIAIGIEPHAKSFPDTKPRYE
jgi:hypothetical protein